MGVGADEPAGEPAAAGAGTTTPSAPVAGDHGFSRGSPSGEAAPAAVRD